jgi:hypothetical protein
MKRALLAVVLLAAPAFAREPLGTFGQWAAFRDTGPTHCFAIAQPVETVRNPVGRPFASIASWPGAGVRGQLHVRLSRPRDRRAAVTLAIGDRRFRLKAGDADAWAPDTATDRAIVAAIRSGRSMSVESMAANAGPFADVYSLAGAPTAIDAAAVACAR